MTKKEVEFCKYIDSLKLKYFGGPEMVRYFRRVKRGVRNSAPPKHKWGNIEQALRVADAAREELGKPIYIYSSYRSPTYNKACGGVTFSRHKEFDALDLHAADKDQSTLYGILLQMRRDGVFKGGVGKYSTFVHVDTRGRNATWSGR